MGKIKKRNKKNLSYKLAYSLLFSVAMVFGAQIQEKGGVSYLGIKTWISISIVAGIAFFVVSILFLLRDRNKNLVFVGEWEEDKRSFFKQKTFWGVAILFLICWLPIFLSAYPGYFLYDAQTELVMVQTAEYTTHHPLSHVLLLGWIIKIIHKLTNSYNAGIAVYLWCQAIFVALSFSYILSRLRAWNVALWIRWISIFYLCVFPIIPMYVFCSTKDVLFSVFLLLFFVNLIDFYRKDRREQEISKKAWVMMLINGIAMLLFRNNGIYALLIAIPFLVGVVGKERKKLFSAVGCLIIGIYILCSWGLQLITHAEKAGSQEILTIPIQQVARVYNYKKDVLTQEEIQILYRYIPEEALLRYKPDLSDQVKIAFNNEEFSRSSGGFLKLWLDIGLKQPFTYLNAFFANNSGFWYPYAELNCYEGNQVFTYTYEDSSYFGYETELPGERKSLIPALDKIIRSLSLEISWQKIPGLRVLFHPAYYFWFFLFGFFYQLSKKRFHICAVAFVALLMYLTVLFGPAVLMRYVLYFYFGFPLLMAFVFADERENVCLGEVV